MIFCIFQWLTPIQYANGGMKKFEWKDVYLVSHRRSEQGTMHVLIFDIAGQSSLNAAEIRVNYKYTGWIVGSVKDMCKE